MGFRQKLGEKKVHVNVLGKGGLDFLKGRYTFAEGEIITFKAKGYKNTFHLRNKTSDIPTFYQCIFDREYDIDLKETPKTIIPARNSDAPIILILWNSLNKAYATGISKK